MSSPTPARIHRRGHIQIAARDPACIVGYFLLDHPEPEVRTWAAARLVAQHPLRGAEPLLMRAESIV